MLNSKINQNLFSNRVRFVLQGFFLAGAISVAETSTVLPLIVNYFGGGEVLIGVLSSLMRGGAIITQLWTAFKTQEKRRVLNSMRKIFAFRFSMWFFIGISIWLFSGISHSLTLVAISIFIFMFSFSAGYGIIYYQELTAKAFTKEYRGKSIAIRQFLSGFAGIIGGGLSGLILKSAETPQSYVNLFLISSIIMAVGFGIFWNFKETEKEKISEKEKNFTEFLKNAITIYKTDRDLRIQIITRFLSYGATLALPFLILTIKTDFHLQPKDIGFFISLQMAGAMLGNIIWGKLSAKNKNKHIIIISYIIVISAYLLTFFADKIEFYYIIYFVIGAAIDGFRLAFSNLILIIAPEDKRPVYVAVNNNLSSLGLFLPIFGGLIMTYLNFEITVIFTISLLIFGLIGTFKLKSQ